MPRFFIDTPQGQNVIIKGQDAVHIGKSLRMKIGDELTLCCNGVEYISVITEISADWVSCLITSSQPSAAEPNIRLHLFQALPKSDKMDFIVQKCVELGAARIVPVSTRRTIVKLDAKKEASRRKRWSGISESAAKQSGRGVLPEITGVKSFQEALKEAEALDVCLIPYERAEDMARTREVLGSIVPGASIGIFIGPEGGFEEEEVEKAMEAGAKAITLGRRILRTETAGMAVLAVLGYLLEE